MFDPEAKENSESAPELTRANVNPESIEGLFLIALEKKTPAERAQFLDEMCGDNAEQRRRVEALLLAYDDAGSFLEKSPVGSSERQPFSLDFLTPADDPNLLGTLGEYQIQEMIGQGGMGIVFRALDPKLNRIVAIKVMSPLLAVNPNARKRFLREAQAAAAVSHPHIVTIHAVDEDKLPYLVMEYVLGQSLQEKLDKVGSLSVTEILRIGNQVAEGLAAAHKQGLIHRDIKPANILLENGVERVKITDFGLARAVDDMTITKTGEVSGTPQYMSPEQAAGDRVDQRSDLFSLGAVLYAMCTGRSPFRASNLAAVVRRVCDDTPRPIQEVNEDIPDWMVEIIDCLLEKRPDDRLQAASEVADLLAAHLAIIQRPGVVPNMVGKSSQPAPRAAVPQPDSLSSILSAGLKKEGTPAGFIATLLIIIFFGVVAGYQWISPSTSESTMTFDVMQRVIPFSLILVASLIVSSLFYWKKVNPKPLPLLTWFLSNLSAFLILWLSFATTTFIRAAPPGSEFQSAYGLILVASLLGGLALTGFVLWGQWLHILKQGPDYVDAVKRKDARILTGIGIGIWVLMVLWNWTIATGFNHPAFLANTEWRFAPFLFLSLLGGGFITVGFLMERSGRQDDAAWHPELEGTSACSMKKPVSEGVARGNWLDRAAVCGGGIMLLIPLFLWLIGTAGGGHFTPSVSEMVVVSLLFFGPLGLLVMVCGIRNLVEPDSKSAKVMEGLFLLACFFLGPIGILLYIARYITRRNECSQAKPEQIPVAPSDDLFVQEHRHSKKRVILGGLIGVVLLLNFYLFVQNWLYLNHIEQFRTLNWDLKLVVVCGMFGAAYFIKQKGATAALKTHWNLMGWGTAVLAGLFSLSLLMQIVSPVSTDTNDLVFIDYRPHRPITEIELLETGEKYQVDSHPAVMHLKKGRHTLRISYSGNGRIHTLDRSINKAKSMSLRIDLSQEIDRLLRNSQPNNAASQPGEPELGAILLIRESSDLQVILIPADQEEAGMFGGGISGGALGIMGRHFTNGINEVSPGTYDVMVSSSLFGWLINGLPPAYHHSKITIKPGEIVDLNVSRNYQKLAENHPDWSQGGLTTFHWTDAKSGVDYLYTLSKSQAEVVQQLLIALGTGKPDVSESALLKSIETDAAKEQNESLKKLFNAGQHPAWESLIIPGKTEGTWRLTEPDASAPVQKIFKSSLMPSVLGGQTAKRKGEVYEAGTACAFCLSATGHHIPSISDYSSGRVSPARTASPNRVSMQLSPQSVRVESRRIKKDLRQLDVSPFIL